MILVRRAVNRGNLPGAEGVLQGVFHLPEAQPVRGDFVAVDIERNDRALVLEVAIDVDEAGDLANFAQQDLCPLIKLGEVGALQRVLVLRRRLLAANANRWRVLHVHLDAGDGSEFRAQLLDDLIGRELAFAARLEDQVERAGVGRRARPATTNRGHEGLNIRVFGDDSSDGPLILDHGGEGGVLRAFGGCGDLPAVAAG